MRTRYCEDYGRGYKLHVSHVGSYYVGKADCFIFIILWIVIFYELAYLYLIY